MDEEIEIAEAEVAEAPLEIKATKLEFNAPQKDVFEILTPVVNTSLLDENGQPVKAFVKEIISIDALNQQKLDLQSKIDIIDAKIKTVEGL